MIILQGVGTAVWSGVGGGEEGQATGLGGQLTGRVG